MDNKHDLIMKMTHPVFTKDYKSAISQSPQPFGDGLMGVWVALERGAWDMAFDSFQKRVLGAYLDHFGSCNHGASTTKDFDKYFVALLQAWFVENWESLVDWHRPIFGSVFRVITRLVAKLYQFWFHHPSRSGEGHPYHVRFYERMMVDTKVLRHVLRTWCQDSTEMPSITQCLAYMCTKRAFDPDCDLKCAFKEVVFFEFYTAGREAMRVRFATMGDDGSFQSYLSKQAFPLRRPKPKVWTLEKEQHSGFQTVVSFVEDVVVNGNYSVFDSLRPLRMVVPASVMSIITWGSPLWSHRWTIALVLLAIALVVLCWDLIEVVLNALVNMVIRIILFPILFPYKVVRRAVESVVDAWAQLKVAYLANPEEELDLLKTDNISDDDHFSGRIQEMAAIGSVRIPCAQPPEFICSVMVGTEGSEGTQFVYAGTGFVFQNGKNYYFCTARHVIRDALPHGDIWLTTYHGGKWRKAAFDPSWRIAVMSVAYDTVMIHIPQSIVSKLDMKPTRFVASAMAGSIRCYSWQETQWYYSVGSVSPHPSDTRYVHLRTDVGNGGASGSPLLALYQGEFRVVGIHLGRERGPELNYGVLIPPPFDQPKIFQESAFRERYGQFIVDYESEDFAFERRGDYSEPEDDDVDTYYSSGNEGFSFAFRDDQALLREEGQGLYRKKKWVMSSWADVPGTGKPLEDSSDEREYESGLSATNATAMVPLNAPSPAGAGGALTLAAPATQRASQPPKKPLPAPQKKNDGGTSAVSPTSRPSVSLPVAGASSQSAKPTQSGKPTRKGRKDRAKDYREELLRKERLKVLDALIASGASLTSLSGQTEAHKPN